MIRGPVKRRIYALGRTNIDAIHRKDVVTHTNVNARFRQRRAKIRIPAISTIDLCNSVVTVFHRYIRTKQTYGRSLHRRHVTTAYKGVTDRDLRAHHVKQIVEICTVHHVRKQLTVHLLHLRPVCPLHVLQVQIVALIPPSLIEYLLEFRFRVDEHPQVRLESSLSCCWSHWRGRVYEKQAGSSSGCAIQ